MDFTDHQAVSIQNVLLYLHFHGTYMLVSCDMEYVHGKRVVEKLAVYPV